MAESLAQQQARLDADPTTQSLLQQYAQATAGTSLLRHTQIGGQYAALFRDARARLGIVIPDGYVFDMGTGQIHEEEGVPWWAWTLPAIGVAVPFVAPALAGAAGGAAGTTTAVGTAGAGVSLPAIVGAGSTAAATAYRIFNPPQSPTMNAPPSAYGPSTLAPYPASSAGLLDSPMTVYALGAVLLVLLFSRR